MFFFWADCLCLGKPASGEDLPSLLAKGRAAFKSGNYEDAERFHRLAVDAAEAGGNKAQRAEAIGDVGGVLTAKGRYDEAESMCLKALGLLREVGIHRYLPVVLNNLGTLSSLRGRYPQAEAYLKESFQVVQKLNPGDLYGARVLNNLGVVHFKSGDRGQAEKDFKQAIAIMENHLGSDHMDLAPLLDNLGGLYVAKRKWATAASLFDRALSLTERLGPDHPHVANSLDGLGAMHFARKNFAEAQQALERAYAIRLKSLGPGHPAVASTAACLAQTLAASGQEERAELLYNDVLQIYEKTFGSRSTQVAVTLEKLTDLFRKTKREGEASLISARARSIRFELEHVVQADALR